MKFIIVGRNIEVTPGLKTAVEDKIGKLEKYYQIPFKLKKYPLRDSETPIVLEDFLY